MPAGAPLREDFETLYDLDDPRPYYRKLAPTGYRMPDIMAAALHALTPEIRAARGRGGNGVLRLLDFACGYGALGVTLRTDLSMADLYGHYAEDGARETDHAVFAARRRRDGPHYAVGGLDIAANAVRYAREVGACEVGFTCDLTRNPPEAGLPDFMRGCDVIAEAGSVGPRVAPALAALLRAAEGTKPWVLFGPRPDFDPAPAISVLEDAGYAIEDYGAPEPYRRPLDAGERETMRAAAQALGHGEADVFDADGFMRVQLRLARPAPD